MRYTNERHNQARVIVRSHAFGDEADKNFVLLPGEAVEIMHGTYRVEDRGYRDLTEAELQTITDPGKPEEKLETGGEVSPAPVAPVTPPAAEVEATSTGPVADAAGDAPVSAPGNDSAVPAETVTPQAESGGGDLGEAAGPAVAEAPADVVANTVIANPDQVESLAGGGPQFSAEEIQSAEASSAAPTELNLIDTTASDMALNGPVDGEGVAKPVETTNLAADDFAEQQADLGAAETMVAEGSPVAPEPEVVEPPAVDETVTAEPEVETPELSATPA